MLVSLIDHLPHTTRDVCQINFNILQAISKAPPKLSIKIYHISEATIVFVILIREEGADPHSSPTEDSNCEGNLSFIT